MTYFDPAKKPIYMKAIMGGIMLPFTGLMAYYFIDMGLVYNNDMFLAMGGLSAAMIPMVALWTEPWKTWPFSIKAGCSRLAYLLRGHVEPENKYW